MMDNVFETKEIKKLETMLWRLHAASTFNQIATETDAIKFWLDDKQSEYEAQEGEADPDDFAPPLFA